MRVGDEGAIVGLAVTRNAMRPGALAIAFGQVRRILPGAGRPRLRQLAARTSFTMS